VCVTRCLLHWDSALWKTSMIFVNYRPAVTTTEFITVMDIGAFSGNESSAHFVKTRLKRIWFWTYSNKSPFESARIRSKWRKKQLRISSGYKIQEPVISVTIYRVSQKLIETVTSVVNYRISQKQAFIFTSLKYPLLLPTVRNRTSFVLTFFSSPLEVKHSV
jgi:hypothetical protein